MKLKNRLSKILCILLLFCCIFAFFGCKQEQKASIFVDLSQSKIAKDSLSLTINSSPVKIKFTSKTPEAQNIFGETEYDVYNICLAGSISTENIKLNATAIKKDGSLFNETDTSGDLFCYTDYFQVAFKLPDAAHTITFDKNAKLEPIDSLHVLDGFYYLNLKWLNMSPDKSTIKPFEYTPDNFIYVQINNKDNNVAKMFLIHITYDIIFI